MNIKKDKKAVAEIIGSVVLLAIAVAAISVVYLYVLSDEGPGPETYVTLVGKIETKDGNTTAVFENRRGETLGLDTEVILQIGGEYGESKRTSVRELSLIFPEVADGWNIGEKIYPALIFSEELGNDLTDVTIDGTIVDEKSNSIVFWGRLQGGYLVPLTGRGGIWHFNESLWRPGYPDVIDSSGNNNNGTAYYTANTCDDVVSAEANRSGRFNGIDDYVEVLNAYSLNLRNKITMEAWIKPFSISLGGITGLLDQFGYKPYITNVLGDRYLFAVVSEDSQQMANLQTINLTPRQQLSENSVIDVEYDIGVGRPVQQKIRPIITHIYGNVYLVALNGLSTNLNLYLKTFNISSDGHIEYTGNNIFDDNSSDLGVGKPNRPSIVRVSDFESYSIFAVAYAINVDGTHPAVGLIRTVNFSHDGKLEYIGEVGNFDDVEGYGPCIIRASSNMFAVAYRDSSNIGIIKTFNISSDGSSIEYTGKDYIFDDKTSPGLNPPTFIKVSDFGSYGVFAIAYGSYINNQYPGIGYIKTIKIYYSNGSIVSTGKSEMFEESTCFDPHMIRHSENYFIVAYSTGDSSNGKYSAIELANNGSIIIRSSKILVLPFQNNQRCVNPIVIKISERGFGIIFESIAGGNGHPGYLIPIEIEYPSDLYSKGIHKLGSYGIYANPNDVYVNINSKTINASIIPNTWNYVVLTYDRSQIKLYVNGIPKNSTSFTEPIKITNSNLIFGDLFYGLIDEVGIYDKVLSAQDIYNHYRQFAPIIIFNVISSDIDYDSAVITWETNVPSNSILRYGTTTPEIEVSGPSGVTSFSITLSGLSSGTTYYYEIQSTTLDGYHTIIDNNGGSYYTFTTENRPPNEPRLPNPTHEQNNVKINTVLSWVGGDPDGNSVTYDVYFGTTNPPPKVVSNQSQTSYDPGILNILTTYYWKIVAWDSYSASAEGPIWEFTTQNAMHVQSIYMWYQVQANNKYKIFTRVTIVDSNGNPVSGATVSLTMTNQDGDVVSFVSNPNPNPTKNDGTATFESQTAQNPGTYTSMVTNVFKTDWAYDLTNSETIKVLTVP